MIAVKPLKNVNCFAHLCLLLASALIACGDPDIEEQALPYYGQGAISDSSAFTVPKFSFINQDSLEISHRDYEGHIYVTDFFFTTCPSICPIMSSQMSRLQGLLDQKGLLGEVKLLSHTVDPEHDRPQVLKEYATRIGAQFEHWNFVTGTQEDLYDQARHGYFMTALVSDTAAGGFFHSDNFVLIDQKMHIRGYYDGTSTTDVDQLLLDIEKLINQQPNEK